MGPRPQGGPAPSAPGGPASPGAPQPPPPSGGQKLGPLDLPKLPGVRQAGKFGVDITVEEGYATARAVALTMLATIKAHCGDLDRVKRVLRLFGMCNCTPDFAQPPQVIDGRRSRYACFGVAAEAGLCGLKSPPLGAPPAPPLPTGRR